MGDTASGVVLVPPGQQPGLPPVSLPAYPAGTPQPPSQNAVIDVGSPTLATPNLDATMARLRAQQAQPPVSTVTIKPSAKQTAQTQGGPDWLENYTPDQAPQPAAGPDWLENYQPPAAAATTPPTTPQPVQSKAWYQPIVSDVLNSDQYLKGLQTSMVHGATFGLDEILSPVPAAAAKSLMQGIPFSQAYDQVVQQQRAQRTQFENANPAASTAAEVVGGTAGAGVFNPLFRSVTAGAPLATRAAAAGQNILTGAALGAGTGFTSADGDVQQRLQGAESGGVVGGVLSALPPVIGEAYRGVRNAIEPLVNPSLAGQRTAGTILNEAAEGPFPTMEPSPVPGLPLNVAQAAQGGNTGLARLVNTISNDPSFPGGPAAHTAEQNAQNQAALSVVHGIAPNADAEAGAGKASTKVTRAVAGERDKTAPGGRQPGAKPISDTEEKRLWNTPAMTKPTVSTDVSKKMMGDYLAKLKAERSGLYDQYEASSLPAIVRDLMGKPEKISAKELNTIRSDLLTMSRDPKADDRVQKIAREMAKVAEDGLWKAPEVVGRGQFTEARRVPAPEWGSGALKTVAVNHPEIPPDPDIVRDLRAARAFTQREAEVLGHNSFDAILRRNGAGNDTVTPGTALNPFFDFKTGTARPGSIANVVKFLGDIKSSWMQLNAAQRAGTYDPAKIDPVMRDLVQGTRDFIMSKMLAQVSNSARDQAGELRTQAARISYWINTNTDMLRESGIFTSAQMDALNALGRAGEMMQRGIELGRGENSATFGRLMGKSWIDSFLSPTIAGIAGRATGAIVGAALGHAASDSSLGFLLGAEGGYLGTDLFQRLYSAPKEQALEWLNRGIRDPRIAEDLVRTANAQTARRMSPATNRWLQSFLATVPASNVSRIGSADKASQIAPTAAAVPAAIAAPTQ